MSIVRNNHRSPGLISAIVATALFALLFLDVPQSMAGKGCEWKAHSGLVCKSGWAGLATGCIGLRNVSGYKVKFHAANSYRIIKKNKTQQADFKNRLSISVCSRWISGEWKPTPCYDVFDRKKNENSGGGCGCKNFKCLPSP